ncbi:MAG: DLW-39 family protein [Jatrophihabitans sp.]
MKKLLAIAAAAAGVQYLLKRKKGQQSSDVWHQATRSYLPDLVCLP